MRLVVQRVSRSSVSVHDKVVSQAGRGLMVLVGLTRDDNDQDIQTLAKKLVNLRVFAGPPSDTSSPASPETATTTTTANDFANASSPTTATMATNDNQNQDAFASSSSPTPSSLLSSSAPFWVNEATTPGAKTWAKSVMDIGGDIMLVSQFTLAHVMKGNKPDFHLARTTEEARVMFDAFVKQVNLLYDAFIKEKSPKPSAPHQQQQQKKKSSAQQEDDSQQQHSSTPILAVVAPSPSLAQVFRGKVAVGAFGEHMEIDMKCDGPVTIILDSNLGEKEREKKEALAAANKENETAASATAQEITKQVKRN